MNFLKLTVLVVFLIAMIIWSSEPSITFKPFKITFSNGYFAAGLLCVVIGLSLIKHQGYKNGCDQVLEVVEDMIKSGNLK